VSRASASTAQPATLAVECGAWLAARSTTPA
jgi:hypothetical protein